MHKIRSLIEMIYKDHFNKSPSPGGESKSLIKHQEYVVCAQLSK